MISYEERLESQVLGMDGKTPDLIGMQVLFAWHQVRR